MRNFVIISGCSGGGKSSILAELDRRGHATVPEPGRRIVEEETSSGGSALPWSDLGAFLRRALVLSREDVATATAQTGWVFFDRGLLDAASGLAKLTGEWPDLGDVRFHPKVFLTPPWPEIYVQDAARRHGLEQATEEYRRLLRDYPALGYQAVELPRMPVADRADLILRELESRM
ncbi:AAA family ATPase [Devosia albogilva]|uniref:AAA family ATPase n=1 Tax=Devosia albogilva TaxID=429726 RepID=A0ABW5QHG2_9HYPH